MSSFLSCSGLTEIILTLQRAILSSPPSENIRAYARLLSLSIHKMAGSNVVVFFRLK